MKQRSGEAAMRLPRLGWPAAMAAALLPVVYSLTAQIYSVI
jgi:hypothetical protein